MARNRTIPFGYMMKDGKITANPKEVLAVVTIFSEYLAGKSLSEIADQMTVPYSDGIRWNKNMVKRILENEKYLGTEIYPQLIGKDIFKAANEKKVKKATSLCIISEELQAVRNMTFCRECGRRLFRSGGNCRSEKWDCHNPECSRYEYRITDNMLIGAIMNILNTVIANPDLIEDDTSIGTYIPTAEINRQQNEINRMIDSLQIDYDKAKDEILRLAEMKYDCCTHSDIPQKTELLKTIITDREQLNTLDIDLMRACISKISVSHFCTIEVEFINGIIIKNTTERKNENAYSSECQDNSCTSTDSGKPQ